MAKQSVSHTIKSRISPCWRDLKYKCKKQKGLTQDLQPHHHELIHFFLLEYLVKGEKGLPVLIPDKCDEVAVPKEEYVNYVLELYNGKRQGYESEQSFQPRQWAEDRRIRSDCREKDKSSSSDEECIRIASPTKPGSIPLWHKKKRGAKGHHANCKSWKKQSTMPVALSTPKEHPPADQPVQAEKHNKLPAMPAAAEPAVELPLKGWDPQQFEVVTDLMQDEPTGLNNVVNLKPVQVRTESQEMAMLYLQPNEFNHPAPLHLAPQARGSHPTSDLPARDHGTAMAMAVCTDSSTELPQDPRNVPQQETNEDFIRETDLLIARGEELLGNLAHQHLLPLPPPGSIPEYAQLCPLDLSISLLVNGNPNNNQN